MAAQREVSLARPGARTATVPIRRSLLVNRPCAKVRPAAELPAYPIDQVTDVTGPLLCAS